MKKVKIVGDSYPFKLTINKLKEFQDESGLKTSEFDDMKFEHMLLLVYKGLEGGHKAEKKDVPFTQDELGDMLELSQLVTLVTSAMSDMGGGDPK